MEPGSTYDPNFYGGIDELFPNDIPEHINGVDSPDHGEIWTIPFEYSIHDSTLSINAILSLIDYLL